MYSRICIFGRPGSGKSTFALKVHTRTGIPLIHLDRFFYTSNWAERDYQEFLTIQQGTVNTNRWIIDGNSLKSLEIRYSHAQICLYFNYPRWVCLWRLIKRIFSKNSLIKDRAEGCQENLRWRLIKYMWTFESRQNNRLVHLIAMLRARYPHVQFIEIRNDDELKKVAKLFECVKKVKKAKVRTNQK